MNLHRLYFTLCLPAVTFELVYFTLHMMVSNIGVIQPYMFKPDTKSQGELLEQGHQQLDAPESEV